MPAKGDRVAEHIEKTLEQYEKRVAKNLNREFRARTTYGERVADSVARFGGSWVFIFTLLVFLALWMVWNTISWGNHLDPFPFILLNLVLSFLAGFQAPFIMMSQNRQSARDRLQADMDFAINIKAEEEIEDMQRDLHKIQRDVATLSKQVQQLLEEVRRPAGGSPA